MPVTEIEIVPLQMQRVAKGGGLDLFDAPTREEAARRRSSGSAYEARVAAVVAGRRRVLDVALPTTPLTPVQQAELARATADAATMDIEIVVYRIP